MAHKFDNPVDFAAHIVRYETDQMDATEIIQFFQDLVDTNLIWQLPANYRRTALVLLYAQLIVMGRESDAL